MRVNQKPLEVAAIHREICERERCSFIDKIDYADDCASCPEGHWGRYGAAECGDAPQSISPVPLPRGSAAESAPLLAVIRQPGDLLATIIFKLTGQMAGMCGPCAERVRQMNEWGWIRCWLNRKIILRWLKEEAAKRGHPIEDAKLSELLKAAFREARKSLT